MNIGKFKVKQERLKKLAPNLTVRLEDFVKFKSCQKEIARNFD
jgi:hypothetical protein